MHPSRPWPSLGILALFSLSLNNLVLHALGGLTNNTIDDSLGDSVTGAKVAYVPDNSSIWKNENECQTCAIIPDTQNAFDNTWTGVTYFAQLGTVTATFSFSGTAIYIYFILSNYPASTGLVSDVLCDFILDGTNVGSYSHTTDGSYAFQYGVLVYSQTGLSNGDHTFVIQPTGALSCYVIFDYAKYTTEVADTEPSSTPTSHTTSSPSPTLVNTPTTPTTTPATPTSSPGSSSSPSSISSSSSTSAATGLGPVSSPPSSRTGSSSTAPSSLSQSSSSSASSSSSTSLSDTQNQNLTAHKTPTGAIAGGVVAGVIVVILVLLALLYFCRRRQQRVSYMPPSTAMPTAFMDEPTSPPPAPLILENEIASKRRTMRELEQRSQMLSPNMSEFPPSSASGGEDFRTQMEMMRAQIERLEAQQRAGYSSSEGAMSSSDRSSSGPILYQHHADSGLRMNGAGQVIDIPPAYA